MMTRRALWRQLGDGHARSTDGRCKEIKPFACAWSRFNLHSHALQPQASMQIRPACTNHVHMHHKYRLVSSQRSIHICSARWLASRPRGQPLTWHPISTRRQDPPPSTRSPTSQLRFPALDVPISSHRAIPPSHEPQRAADFST